MNNATATVVFKNQQIDCIIQDNPKSLKYKKMNPSIYKGSFNVCNFHVDFFTNKKHLYLDWLLNAVKTNQLSISEFHALDFGDRCNGFKEHTLFTSLAPVKNRFCMELPQVEGPCIYHQVEQGHYPFEKGQFDDYLHIVNGSSFLKYYLEKAEYLSSYLSFLSNFNPWPPCLAYNDKHDNANLFYLWAVGNLLLLEGRDIYEYYDEEKRVEISERTCRPKEFKNPAAVMSLFSQFHSGFSPPLLAYTSSSPFRKFSRCFASNTLLNTRKQFLEFLYDYISYSNPSCKCFAHLESEIACEISNFVISQISEREFTKKLANLKEPLKEFPSLRNVPKEDVAASLFQHAYFYTNYKHILSYITSWLSENQTLKTEKTFFEDLLGNLQIKFLDLYLRCLNNHPLHKVFHECTLLYKDLGKYQLAMETIVKGIEKHPNDAILLKEKEKLAPLVYFDSGYQHFKEGKISAYIEDIQNLKRSIQFNSNDLSQLAQQYSETTSVSEEIMPLFIHSITQLIEYLNRDSPIQDSLDQKFEFILAEAKNIELNYHWKDALNYEKLAKLFQLLSSPLYKAKAILNYPESQYLQIEGKKFEHAEFVFINGIDNELKDAIPPAQLFSEYTGGYQVHVLFNATQGKLADILKWLLAYTGNYLTPGVALTIQFIRDHFKKNPNKKLFFVTHSCGGAILKAALKEIPEELRDLIIINNMGGGAYIPKNLCKNATNYISLNDSVSHFANFEKLSKVEFDANNYEFRILAPEPGAPKIDHPILSSTYQKAIIEFIKDFIDGEAGNV